MRASNGSGRAAPPGGTTRAARTGPRRAVGCCHFGDCTAPVAGPAFCHRSSEAEGVAAVAHNGVRLSSVAMALSVPLLAVMALPAQAGLLPHDPQSPSLKWSVTTHAVRRQAAVLSTQTGLRLFGARLLALSLVLSALALVIRRRWIRGATTKSTPSCVPWPCRPVTQPATDLRLVATQGKPS